MPDTYSGPVRLTDTAGERHPLAATLELPGNRWWDHPFVSPFEIDLLLGSHARVHGHAWGAGRASAARHSIRRAHILSKRGPR